MGRSRYPLAIVARLAASFSLPRTENGVRAVCLWPTLELMHSPPIRVVIDLEKSRNHCSGLGQFACHLGRALTTETRRRGLSPVALVAEVQRETFGTPEVLVSKTWRKEIFQRWYRWTGWTERPLVSLWHATHQQAKYLPLDPHTPVVLTIHDLNYLREKNGKKIERQHRRIRRLIARSSAVTVISQFVADEVCTHFNLGHRPLKVIYNGRPDISQITPMRPDWMQDERPYLFSIGIIDRKKNFHVLINLLKALPQHRLILAGRNDSEYADEIRQLAQAAQVADRCLMPGPVTDAQRQWLYEHCEAFVFPSLTEGFGLPPIEAMTMGKPVFLARRTSLPEIGGPHAFYWDDFSPQHLIDVFLRGMETYRADPAYPAALRATAARFSWEDAARQYVDLYQQVLGLPQTDALPCTRAA